MKYYWCSTSNYTWHSGCDYKVHKIHNSFVYNIKSIFNWFLSESWTFIFRCFDHRSFVAYLPSFIHPCISNFELVFKFSSVASANHQNRINGICYESDNGHDSRCTQQIQSRRNWAIESSIRDIKKSFLNKTSERVK